MWSGDGVDWAECNYANQLIIIENGCLCALKQLSLWMRDAPHKFTFFAAIEQC